jgi:YCII-related domain
MEIAMKKFLAVYTGDASSKEKSAWNALSSEERARREQSGMKAWGEWMSAHQAEIVDTGGPLGKTKCADGNGVTDVKNQLTAYVIVQAASHEAAAAVFEKHPHFTIFPGLSVEIMECLPIPSQPKK